MSDRPPISSRLKHGEAKRIAGALKPNETHYVDSTLVDAVRGAAYNMGLKIRATSCYVVGGKMHRITLVNPTNN